MRALLALTAALLAAPALAGDSYTILRCGQLLAVPGEPPRKEVTLIVKNGRVDSIVPGHRHTVTAKLDGPEPDTVTEIDLKDSFVLPGFIDCHVHLSMQSAHDRLVKGVTESEADQTINATIYARRTLEAGFTTVRDVGSGTDAVLALRDAINAGRIDGPRIVAAGKGISVTGGHGDPTNGYIPDRVAEAGVERGVADGPDACMQAVRHQVKRGADVIKITATGGVLSISNASLGQHFTDAELAAIVESAGLMGRKVCAHAHGVTGINAALRAGVDSIEHGTYLDDESVRLFKLKGAYLVPTLLAGATVTKHASEPGYYHAFVARKAAEVGPKMLGAFRKAHEGGVKIAFGTDTGVSPHGENAQEFALMVEGGMTPMEAIRAATVSAADLLSMSEEVGTLEAGKWADLVAVRGDPLADMKLLEKIGFVMKAGAVVKRE